jgi:ribonucleoside-diphosphate reductase alpha chain
MSKLLELPKETLEWFENDELRARVFLEKYALRDYNGNIIERTPPEMWRRVARAISSVEQTEDKRQEWYEKFYWLLENFRMVPGGRIMFGAGQEQRKATLLNCYVLPIKGDSIEDIYETMKEMARTYSFGGGVGIDISVLRPKGSPVNNAAYTSTGAVSFMDLYSLTTGTIGQSGRRGALMITINCQHPDVEEFITIKNDPLRMKVRYANISVQITDEFMNAVLNDDDWELWYPDIMRESDLIKEFGTSDINEVLSKLQGREDFVAIDLAKRSFYDMWLHTPTPKVYFYVTNKNEIRKRRVYKVVKAKDIWNKIIHNAWASAEPGVIFISTMKKNSTSEYDDMYVLTTNPCSEIPLEPYGDCCLGNINLERFVLNEFTNNAEVDWENLEKAVRYTVRFLDNVLDYNRYRHPLKEQSEASMRSRRIGVGFTGLGDMLIKMQIKYDSDEAIDFVDELFDRIKNIAYDESVNLAIEKGKFPAFDPKKHLKSPFIKKLDKEVQERIKEYGLRNVALLTVPPVGSGALLAGVTSGIEPVFALSYVRRSESLSKEFFKVYHPLVKRYMEKYGIKSEEELPDFFVTAHEIDPYFRVKMQATIQKHIDHSISSTVNLPSDTTEKTISDIYFYSWKLKCKGITVYREGSREGVLITEQKASEKKEEAKPSFKRPRIMVGETVKFRLPQGSLYVTVNKDENNQIKEVFINIGKSGGDEKADAEAIGRLISIYLQSGGDIETVIEQLEGIKGSETFWDQGIALHSIPDAVSKALMIIYKGQYKEDIKVSEKTTHKKQERDDITDSVDHAHGTNDGNGTISLVDESSENQVQAVKLKVENAKMEKCPSCGENALVNENGCFVCKSCGYTKCS